MRRTHVPILASLSFLAALGLAAAADLPAVPDSAEKLTQSSWAKLLVDRLGLTLPSGSDQATELLGGRGPAIVRDSRSAQLMGVDGGRRTYRFDLAVSRTALWLLETRNTVQSFVTLDKRPSTLVAAAPSGGLSDVGFFGVVAGTHTVTVVSSGAPQAPEIDLV